MKKNKFSEHILVITSLVILVGLFSCKPNYKEEIKGFWRLEKTESIESGKTSTSYPRYSMYYEFSQVIGIDLVKYNSQSGLRNALPYTINNNLLETSYLLTDDIDINVLYFKNQDKINYSILKLNNERMLLELKNTNNPNIILKYYCIRVKNENEIKEILIKKNKEWDATHY